MKGSKMKNDIMEEMLGYRPDKETRLLILKTVKETGKSMQEVISTGGIVPLMPTQVLLGLDGKFDFEGQRITADQWGQLNPLGYFGKLIIVGTKERIALHRRLSPGANYKNK